MPDGADGMRGDAADKGESGNAREDQHMTLKADAIKARDCQHDRGSQRKPNKAIGQRRTVRRARRLPGRRCWLFALTHTCARRFSGNADAL